MQSLLWPEIPHLFTSNFGVAAQYPAFSTTRARTPRAPSHPPAGPALGAARPPSAARSRRVYPRGPRAPESHAPAPPALSGVALQTCLGLGERLQALRCEPGEHEMGAWKKAL
jgi:hypothetical protein